MHSTENKKTDKNVVVDDQKIKTNKCFLCFRPVVMDGLLGQQKVCGGGRRGGDPVFEYVKLEHNTKDHGVVFPGIFPATSPSSSNESVACPKRKGRKSLSRLLKAVMFETSLGKKIKKRKVFQKMHMSNGRLSEKVEKDLNPEKKKKVTTKHQEFAIPNKYDGRISANSRSSLWSSPSTSFSSLSSNSRLLLSDASRSFQSNSTELKPNQQDNVEGTGTGHHNSTTGLCLFLVSLVVLVFWGKLCAILCTSTWLFLVPHCSKARKSSSQTVPDQGIDSEEYKKKIIMEGLLERNRSRVL